MIADNMIMKRELLSGQSTFQGTPSSCFTPCPRFWKCWRQSKRSKSTM